MTAADWLIANLDLIPRLQPVLDVASGKGRHAIFLAERGWRVRAIDRNESALAALEAEARSRGVHVETSCVDLEADDCDLGVGRYGAVLVFNYLHRPLMPQLIAAVKPGGVLLYETFTIGQRERGHPRNPDFLLAAGELAALVAPLELLRSREGDFGGKLIASVAARKRLP